MIGQLQTQISSYHCPVGAVIEYNMFPGSCSFFSYKFFASGRCMGIYGPGACQSGPGQTGVSGHLATPNLSLPAPCPGLRVGWGLDLSPLIDASIHHGTNEGPGAWGRAVAWV